MQNNKKRLFDHLAQLGINTTTVEHEPLFTVEQAQALAGKIPGAGCKNLFLKDDKKKLWLIIALDNTQVSLKLLAKKIGAPGLRFASAEQLFEFLGVLPGSATPSV